MLQLLSHSTSWYKAKTKQLQIAKFEAQLLHRQFRNSIKKDDEIHQFDFGGLTIMEVCNALEIVAKANS